MLCPGDRDAAVADLGRFRPDVAVVNAYDRGRQEWARTMLAAVGRVPALLYVHDAGSVALAREAAGPVAAVSRFVAELIGAERAVVIPPIVDPRDYCVTTTRRMALFVNPVSSKGLATVLRVAARRRDVPFAFARCWRVHPRAERGVAAAVRRLGNVELRPPVMDPAALYGDARVLLAPSVYPEAFGRVAREAQTSGIPVIAARRGGLPETVGRGGVLVDPEAGVAEWVEAFDRLWHDPLEYARVAAAARRQAAEGDCSASSVGSRFEALLRAAVCSDTSDTSASSRPAAMAFQS